MKPEDLTLSDLSDGELQELAARCFDVQCWHQEDMAPERECVWCHSSVHTPSHLEPTPTCNLCAQRVVGLLPEMVAELQRHRAAQRADAVRVRSVVRDAVLRGLIGQEMHRDVAEPLAKVIADRVAAEIATAEPAIAPVLSAHDRKVIGWIIEDAPPVHMGDLIRRTMERVLGLRPEAPILSAEERVRQVTRAAVLQQLEDQSATVVQDGHWLLNATPERRRALEFIADSAADLVVARLDGATAVPAIAPVLSAEALRPAIELAERCADLEYQRDTARVSLADCERRRMATETAFLELEEQRDAARAEVERLRAGIHEALLVSPRGSQGAARKLAKLHDALRKLAGEVPCG